MLVRRLLCAMHRNVVNGVCVQVLCWFHDVYCLLCCDIFVWHNRKCATREMVVYLLTTLLLLWVNVVLLAP